MSALGRAVDRWLGRGGASITTPPMDGALRPNDLLDVAAPALAAPAPDNLAITSRGLAVSSGSSLLRVDNDAEAPLAAFDAEISAATGLPDGGAAVGLVDGRIVFVGGAREGETHAAASARNCITALAPGKDGALFVANGSATNAPTEWKRDLMQKNASGSVWRLAPHNGGWTQIAANLAYPCGMLEDDKGVVVCESWRSALTRIEPGAGGQTAPLLENLPAYPSRIAQGRSGEIWLALFAPRSQLVEFVLSEDNYRRRMIAEVPSEHWVAPCLRSGQSPLEPTQQGGVKQLGVLKPWSPSRSYGLVARLDGAYRPTASFHSRANGRRHGVTSCLPFGGRLYFSAKGDGIVASFACEEPAA